MTLKILTINATATYMYLLDARAYNYIFTCTVDIKLQYTEEKKNSSTGLIGDELALPKP